MENDARESSEFDLVNPFLGLFRRGDTMPVIYNGLAKEARVFHIDWALFHALNGAASQDEDGPPLYFADAYAMRHPFDRYVVAFRNAPWLPMVDGPGSFRHSEIMVVRHADSNGFKHLLIMDKWQSSKDPDGVLMHEAAQMVATPYGMSPFYAILPKVPGIAVLRQIIEDACNGQFTAYLSKLVGFCDMLQHVGELVTLRRMVGGKHKVCTAISGGDPRARYEILLRRERSVSDIARLTAQGLQMLRRAHPRRHSVREHYRNLGDKIVVVRSHDRGGKIGAGPHYNCGPISQWYASQRSGAVASQ